MNTFTSVFRNKLGNIALRHLIRALCVVAFLVWPLADAQGAPDRFEVDDTPEIAVEIFIEDSDFPDPLPPKDFRNFHSPDDVDWVIFFAPQDSQNNNSFTIRVQAEVDGGNTTNTEPDFTVFDQSGVKACAEDSLLVGPEDTCLIEDDRFTPFVEGFYYIKLVNSRTDLFNEETAYTIRIGGVFGDQIFGLVRDAVTGELLPGVTIAIQGTQLITQSIEAPRAGYYLLLLPGVNSVTVIASHPGYKPYQRENIPIKSNAEQIDIDLEPEFDADLLVAFVTRFYRLVLDREPDPQGLFTWVRDLNNLTLTGADLARGFILSEEFVNRNKNDGEYLTILYLAFFDRKPDTGGFNAWFDLLRTGMTREEVLNGFLFAQEFIELARKFRIKPFPGAKGPREQEITDFVTRFYELILGRAPDPVGLEGWVDDLLSLTRTGADIARGFINSKEFIDRAFGDEEYVRILYRAFFDRDADAAGLAEWLRQLNSGRTRDDILNGFLFSQEFAELAARFGINAT